MPPSKKTPRFLLIDYENVQDVDLLKTDGDLHIAVFMGDHQKKLSVDLVMKYQKLGSRLEWRPIEGNGKNALDFVIAYQMGRILEKTPNACCIILSKDTGFDPLLKMLAKDGKHCKRIESLAELK